MATARFDLKDGSDRSHYGVSRAELQYIVGVSPAVGSLLPALMRSMADEIEKVSDSHVTPDADLIQRYDPAIAGSVARVVATEISIALGSHLILGQRDDATRNVLRLSEDVSPAPLPPPKLRLRFAGEPRLELKLLGTPEITLDGSRLIALEHCSRAALILYVLALHPGGLSGERLAAYIISDIEDIDALDTDAALSPAAHRTFIWRLRKLAGWRDIVTSHCEQGGRQNRYMLPNNTSCDVWIFEQNLDEAARLIVRARIEPDAADRAASLRQEAILLYDGEFCTGVGAGSIARAADYLRNRYLQAVMSQATYWKDRALKSRETGQHVSARSRLSVEEEKSWLEALNNYRLAAHAEPYEQFAHEGVRLCEAHLGRSNRVRKAEDRFSQVRLEAVTRPRPHIPPNATGDQGATC